MLLIDGFNKLYNNIAASYIKVGNESMSAINFRNTEKGGGSYLSYIFHKPEPMGVDFKNVACSVTVSLVLIYIYRGG